MSPNPIVVAFSLMVEEPGLPPEAALLAAQYGSLHPALVEPLELLRLAAVGYRLEQT